MCVRDRSNCLANRGHFEDSVDDTMKRFPLRGCSGHAASGQGIFCSSADAAAVILEVHRDGVSVGREFVRAYVEYIHYVEQLYEAAKGPAGGHGHESVPADPHKNK